MLSNALKRQTRRVSLPITSVLASTSSRNAIRFASQISKLQSDAIVAKSYESQIRSVMMSKGRGLSIPDSIPLLQLDAEKPPSDKPSANSKTEKDENSNDKEESEKEETPEEKEKDKPELPKRENNLNISSIKAVSSAGSSSASAGSSSGGGNNNKPKKASVNSFELPEVYPQIIALPISRRPLFPGFYKAVIISDVNVIKAIKESLDKEYPFIGCFLFKDENMESDVIHSKDEIYETGVLAQVTSNVFTQDQETGTETLTTVLYPHTRIKIDDLFPPNKETSKTGEDGSSGGVTTVNVSALKDLPKKSVQKKNIIEGITGEKEGDEPKNLEEPHNILTETDDGSSSLTLEEEEDNPTAFLKKYPITLVNVSNVEDEPYEADNAIISSLTAAILEVLKEISTLNKSFSDQLATFSASLHNDIFNCPEKLADFAAAVTAGSQTDLQEILDCTDIKVRLEKALTILKKELMNKELQKKIERDLEDRMTKRHREFHLNEQLKWIKKELGIDDGRDKLIAKYNERVANLKMPEEVRKVYDDEINKLSTLEPLMSEFTVTRNYLDWLTQIPWGKQTKDEYAISKAKTILDEDHYGLKDVKDRILEFIAVGKLLNKINGKIICFVGPPGVGKTSIGKSIARALNRKFYRFSVGGLSDVAEIKGHRRTYVGAIPGRVVQALKKTESENPLILIDEIDKMSHHHAVNGGDPSAALLELLDPEQNNAFLDNYMDVPIDLSKVLFVCTANSLSTIPGPLLDRMEVIEISGYIADEKIKIAENYLSPDAKKSAGLETAHVTLTEEALESLIKNYCRESGVRNLKKQIEKIYRKAALNFVKEIGEDKVIDIKEEEKEEKEAVEDKEKAAKSPELEKDAKETEAENSEKQSNGSEELKTEEQASQVVIPDSYEVTITPESLKDYIGPAIYTSDRLYETTPAGVVMGLAWTSNGGASLYIESVLEQAIDKDSQPRLERTGQLGDVMKESVRIAYSFSKMYLAKNYSENKFFSKAQIHLHCPEGATPKDGPSAGITITSSLLSLALNKPLDPTVAMTGEITLTGKVLRIGGLKEKAIAAKRSGIKTIIFPKDNLADWNDLPDNVKEGLTPVPADWYDDVFKTLFSVSEEEGNQVWKSEFAKIEEEKKKDDK